MILHCVDIFSVLVFNGYFFPCYSFVSISMGLCACNSAGHLSNHADLAPNHAGVTFAVSNTIVSKANFLKIHHFIYKFTVCF